MQRTMVHRGLVRPAGAGAMGSPSGPPVAAVRRIQGVLALASVSIVKSTLSSVFARSRKTAVFADAPADDRCAGSAPAHLRVRAYRA